jgi:hypothetical protein
MPVSFGGTNTPGDQARLFPWQMSHYIVHGGPNDPVIQSAAPPTQASPGYLGWSTVLTLPPVPGTQTPPAVPLPRVQSLNSTGTLSSGVLGSNTGGLYIGTIPQGAWILDLSLYCYVSLAGGTSTSIGIFYAAADTVGAGNAGGQPTSLNNLAYITSPTAGNLYTAVGAGDAGTTAFTAVGNSTTPLGPGTGTSGVAQLASLSDIDLYVVGFLVAGTGTANTNGAYAVKVEFTGLEG